MKYIRFKIDYKSNSKKMKEGDFGILLRAELSGATSYFVVKSLDDNEGDDNIIYVDASLAEQITQRVTEEEYETYKLQNSMSKFIKDSSEFIDILKNASKRSIKKKCLDQLVKDIELACSQADDILNERVK